MSETVMLSISKDDLQTLIIDSVKVCLKHNPLPARPIEESLPDIGGMALAIEITSLKKPTIYGKVRRGEIPHYKKGGRLYFSRRDLDAWIKEGAVKTAKEIDAEADDYINGKRK
jgi:excisionase family DNA binding protein